MSKYCQECGKKQKKENEKYDVCYGCFAQKNAKKGESRNKEAPSKVTTSEKKQGKEVKWKVIWSARS